MQVVFCAVQSDQACITPSLTRGACITRPLTRGAALPRHSLGEPFYTCCSSFTGCGTTGCGIWDTVGGHCQGACRPQWFFHLPLQVSERGPPFRVVIRAHHMCQTSSFVAHTRKPYNLRQAQDSNPDFLKSKARVLTIHPFVFQCNPMLSNPMQSNLVLCHVM